MFSGKLKFFLPILFFGAMVAMFADGLQRDPSEVPSTLIGKPAPAFDLPRLLEPGQRLRNTDLTGDVSLLNVWGSWCVGCAQEHELLLLIARESGVPIYGLNWKDDRDAAIDWLVRLGNPYVAVGVDPDNYTGIDYGVYGAPETFVIDKDGIIRHKHIGPLSRDTWFDELWPMVKNLRGEGS